MFIRQESAMAYLPQVIELMTAHVDGIDEFDDELAKAQNERFLSTFQDAISAEVKPFLADNWYYSNPPFTVNNILVIPIRGAIMPQDYCGCAGTATIMSWYEKAKQDSSITGVLELADSGGGAVFGTPELANYKVSYPKPVLTLVEGLCCSAMEFIALGSDQIWATSEVCICGSIGVMTSFRNFKEYYAKQGISIFDIYSKASPLKNNASRLAEKGDLSGYTDGILFEMDKAFMGFASSRRKLSQKVLDGADMVASEGMNEGLIDKIGSLTEAINYLQNKTKEDMKISASAVMRALGDLFSAESVEINVEDNPAGATTTPPEPAAATTPEPAAATPTPEEIIAAKDQRIAELQAKLDERKGVTVARAIPVPEAHVDKMVSAPEASADISYYAIPPVK